MPCSAAEAEACLVRLAPLQEEAGFLSVDEFELSDEVVTNPLEFWPKGSTRDADPFIYVRVDETKFKFYVEATGALRPEEIVISGIRELSRKLHELQMEVNAITEEGKLS